MYLPSNLKAIRGYHKMSQTMVCKALSLKRTTWSNYETGTSTPTVQKLMAIAEFLGVTETELLRVDIRERIKQNNNRSAVLTLTSKKQ